tara:strand:- start:151 stop:510 length:360 start_codon:yes stop_codon:yes gene_type:complete
VSIFQCQVCGCAENTATGWYHAKDIPKLNKPEDLGIAKCSACTPQVYIDGTPNKKFNGEWHGKFKRHFLPHGEFFTNSTGNLEHNITGLAGHDAYMGFGRDVMYPKDTEVYPLCLKPKE